MTNENSEHPRITFIIQHPSRDLDSESYTGARIYTRGAVHSLDNIVPSQAVRATVGFPAYILEMVDAAFDDGHYRVELLIGETEYKFYRKPPRDLVPKEEDGTPLEGYQRAKAADCPVNLGEL